MDHLFVAGQDQSAAESAKQPGWRSSPIVIISPEP